MLTLSENINIITNENSKNDFDKIILPNYKKIMLLNENISISQESGVRGWAGASRFESPITHHSPQLIVSRLTNSLTSSPSAFCSMP